MVIIPFIYFSALTAYWWHTHKSFDVCVYMSSLYAFSALCSIIIVSGGFLDSGGVLFDETDLELNIAPTVLYCAVHTIALLPFSMIYNKDLNAINPPCTPKVLDCVCWLMIAVALLNIYLIADSTLEILSGNLELVRADHYKGIESPADIKAQSLPSVFAYFYYFNFTTTLALPLFFYYLCIETSKQWWFKLALFVASLSVPLRGLQAADRTEIMLYSMMVVFNLIFFRKFLTRKIKRILLFGSIPIIVAVAVYLVAVSVARFDKREGGALESATQYAGQSYLNFCYFWEHGKFDYIATEREFPLINHFVYGINSDPDRRADRTGKHGFFISVFPSYLGDIMLDLSPIGMLMWLLCFFFVVMFVIRQKHREELNVGEASVIAVIAVIPVFGVFYYKFMVFQYTIMFSVVAILYFFSKYKIRLL